MAAGTGRVVADMVAGRRAAIDTSGLGVGRYRAAWGARAAARAPHAAAARM
jgi:hypothetical protein